MTDTANQRYAHSGTPEDLFNAVLHMHVKDGSVNYAALRNDPGLREYCDILSQTGPQFIADPKAQLAFWINVYNAYTLKVICDEQPVRSISELHAGGLVVGTLLQKTVWDKQIIAIKGTKYSLNEIEHKILRRIYKEPRIHFALVCGARGCPVLRTEAYTAALLDNQLTDQAKRFMTDNLKNSIDANKKELTLSKIFDWYREDFGGDDVKLLLYLARFLPPDSAQSIIADPGAWSIRYREYDWTLNKQ